jgi:hypothetical protein
MLLSTYFLHSESVLKGNVARQNITQNQQPQIRQIHVDFPLHEFVLIRENRSLIFYAPAGIFTIFFWMA